MIPELLNGTSHGFPKCVNVFLQLHKFWDLAAKEQYTVDSFNSKLLGPTRLFLSTILMRSQKRGNVKPTKCETTDMGTCKDVSEKAVVYFDRPFLFLRSRS